MRVATGRLVAHADADRVGRTESDRYAIVALADGEPVAAANAEPDRFTAANADGAPATDADHRRARAVLRRGGRADAGA